ncbi:purine-nucleoside phosphorylase [Candidatus Mycoplasma haematohominis]|uniref:Uridine phosphorylase n=1 Tax=Candidatus Mycoplasma haematohominis TaxID=1494318 RepID=A0A478FPB9_9MOLU|nr:purine-nucleoside phosphorylase [Candidatus Mycoplasma haemohominis]GCE63173.1 purine nucleoside phosphorylase DeoD-type [Candidatus Mycoplasma haemohominis]
MTPHISAAKEEIAKLVFLAGDPLRAKWVAEKYLQNYKLVSSVRNIYFYTGEYNGKRITVGASGMGYGSMGIYAHELFNFYDVDAIVRIGSCGAYSKDLKVGSVVIVDKSKADSSSYAEVSAGESYDTISPSGDLDKKIEAFAKEKGIQTFRGNVHSSNVFYSSLDLEKTIKEKEVIAVEMESFALFVEAKRANKQAACILTVSDIVGGNEKMTPEERVTCLENMISVALGGCC